ncbi:MAG TPA: GNAT family N-acetyltransferase [Acidimicrobiia bacterium]|nr:GNAT family N-acetyltransferase [Acidimicrobiia bacterium]
MEIRPVRPEEWVELSQLRLRALAAAPDAFSATLADAASLDEQEWRRRAIATPQQVTLVAVEGAHLLVGMCAVIREPGNPAAQLVAMWVEPDHRSRGVGAALVESAAAWTRDSGADLLRLWVNEDNAPAIRLYGEHGFNPTGERERLRPRSKAMMIAMCRTITPDPASGPAATPR